MTELGSSKISVTAANKLAQPVTQFRRCSLFPSTTFIYSMLVHNNLVQEAEYSQSAGVTAALCRKTETITALCSYWSTAHD